MWCDMHNSPFICPFFKVSTVAKETALALATRDICQDDANYDDLNDAYVSGANINGDKALDPGIWYASKIFLLYCTLLTYSVFIGYICL